MTAPSLSIPAGTLVVAWQQVRVVLPPRALAGVGFVLAAILASALLNGSRLTLDPQVPLIVAVLGAGLLGGLRGAIAAAVLAIAYGFFLYAPPHAAGTAGNGLRVLVFAASTGLTAVLAGLTRERLERITGDGSTRDMLGRVRRFSAGLADVRAQTLAAAIVSRVAALVGADMAALTVIDPRTGRHVVRAVVGTANSAVGVEVLSGVGLAGQAIRDHQLVWVGRAIEQPAPYAALRRQLIDRLGGQPAPAREPAAPNVAPAVAVPALNAGSVVATVTLGRTDAARPFTDDEKALLEAVAPLIGTVVANALIRNQLREASLIDPLTGLCNRSYLEAALEQLLALRRRLPIEQRSDLSLIMFDIDGFRALNERHGQAVGDQVLRAMAALLRQRFRASDTIARIGGDAFVVVLDGATQTVAVEVAGQVRAQLREMALADDHGNSLSVSASAGCAMFRDEAARGATILRTVEAALDTARWSGPGAVVAI